MIVEGFCAALLPHCYNDDGVNIIIWTIILSRFVSSKDKGHSLGRSTLKSPDEIYAELQILSSQD